MNALRNNLTDKQRHQLEIEREVLNAELELNIVKRKLLTAKLIDIDGILNPVLSGKVTQTVQAWKCAA